MHFTRFEDILSGKTNLAEAIESLVSTFSPNPTFELNQNFDSFIVSNKKYRICQV